MMSHRAASAHQVPDGDVEVGVATAAVGDLGEGVSGQDVLRKQKGHEAAQPGPPGLTAPQVQPTDSIA